MKAILATNFEELNKYILQNVPEIEVIAFDIETQIEALENIRDLKNIDFILLSDLLRGATGLSDFLQAVVEEKEDSTQVYYIAQDYEPELLKKIAEHNIKYFRKGAQSLGAFIAAILEEDVEENNSRLKETIRELKNKSLLALENKLAGLISRKLLRQESPEELQEAGEKLKGRKLTTPAPRDYRKIIGIFNPCPYPVGKTTLAVNLAAAYLKQKRKVSLIDTDFKKKDLIYHFNLNENSIKENLVKLMDDTKQGRVKEIEPYAMYIENDLELFVDSRDSEYTVSPEMIVEIMKYTESNIIIIDISKNLEPKEIESILLLCNERILVVDKMIPALSQLPPKICDYNPHICKMLSLVVNKDVKTRNLNVIEIEKVIRKYKMSKDPEANFEFSHRFSIPEFTALMAESLVDAEPAYGKIKEFDNAINKIIESHYKK